MTAKRYYAHKHLNEDKVHDKICHRFMNITETVEHMNMYYQKYTALKKENEQLKEKIKREIGHNQRLHSDNCELHKENEQLKQLLDYADDLIQSYMSVHNRDEWENVKKNITGDVE